jgi:hypothetical protein
MAVIQWLVRRRIVIAEGNQTHDVSAPVAEGEKRARREV